MSADVVVDPEAECYDLHKDHIDSVSVSDLACCCRLGVEATVIRVLGGCFDTVSSAPGPSVGHEDVFARAEEDKAAVCTSYVGELRITEGLEGKIPLTTVTVFNIETSEYGSEREPDYSFSGSPVDIGTLNAARKMVKT